MAKSKKVVKLQPAPPLRDVGAQVSVAESDQQAINAAEQHLLQLQLHFAQKTEEFEQYKAQILQAVGDARRGYTDLVLNTGRALGLDIGDDSKERWEFKREQMIFVRIG